MKKTLAIILVLMLTLAVVACGGGGDSIAGKWTPEMSAEESAANEALGVEARMIMEFASGGKFSSYMDVKGEGTMPFDVSELATEGTYKVDGDKVTVNTVQDGQEDSFTATFKVEGDKLTLTRLDSDSETTEDNVMVLNRVK